MTANKIVFSVIIFEHETIIMKVKSIFSLIIVHRFIQGKINK
jgi:hypothetical protein